MSVKKPKIQWREFTKKYGDGKQFGLEDLSCAVFSALNNGLPSDQYVQIFEEIQTWQLIADHTYKNVSEEFFVAAKDSRQKKIARYKLIGVQERVDFLDHLLEAHLSAMSLMHA